MSSLLEPLKIGPHTLKNRLFCAPMVDVTDLPYRLICQEAGAGYTCTEMLYVDAITHENAPTKKLMETSPQEDLKIIQVTGNTLAEFKKALPILKTYDIVDLNCGCPSIRITGNKAGSYLLTNPKKIASIVKLLTKAGITTTVKIRLGFKEYNALEVAQAVEKAGAQAITVHCRLATHSNKTPADWSWIPKIKQALKIPVIGNGDVTSPERAKQMLTLCDGVMIARAAMGDPDLFVRCITYAKDGTILKKDFARNRPYLAKYIAYCKQYNFQDFHRIKQVAGSFLSDFPQAAQKRQALHACKTFAELEIFIQKLE
ncbi:tRNA dihydrouridine synthase DusB [Candidatus Pacearchaeota archaeon]|nr:tRNA dihydrouridine synthase DusB [Candidatus Pacearchaeota archaeon]